MKEYDESKIDDVQAIVDTVDGFRKWKISVDSEDAFWFDAQRRKVQRRIRGKPLKETKAETFHRIRTEYEGINKRINEIQGFLDNCEWKQFSIQDAKKCVDHIQKGGGWL